MLSNLKEAAHSPVPGPSPSNTVAWWHWTLGKQHRIKPKRWAIWRSQHTLQCQDHLRQTVAWWHWTLRKQHRIKPKRWAIWRSQHTLQCQDHLHHTFAWWHWTLGKEHRIKPKCWAIWTWRSQHTLQHWDHLHQTHSHDGVGHGENNTRLSQNAEQFEFEGVSPAPGPSLSNTFYTFTWWHWTLGKQHRMKQKHEVIWRSQNEANFTVSFSWHLLSVS